MIIPKKWYEISPACLANEFETGNLMQSFFLYYAITKAYIARNAFTSPKNSKLILLKDTKNYKLAIAQTCNFLNASSPKIS
jgi:hypothetical protein